MPNAPECDREFRQSARGDNAGRIRLPGLAAAGRAMQIAGSQESGMSHDHAQHSHDHHDHHHGSDLSPMATPEEIIAEARNGRMFILVDDEDRQTRGLQGPEPGPDFLADKQNISYYINLLLKYYVMR